MDIARHIKDASGIWRSAEPASAEVVKALAAEASVDLPASYFSFLLVTNGGEGSLAVEPGWFCPWEAAEVMPLNAGYNVNENLPGFFAFGSNGGGALFAFDTRREKPWPVVMIPCIPMEGTEAVAVAENFDEFLQYVANESQAP